MKRKKREIKRRKELEEKKKRDIEIENKLHDKDLKECAENISNLIRSIIIFPFFILFRIIKLLLYVINGPAPAQSPRRTRSTRRSPPRTGFWPPGHVDAAPTGNIFIFIIFFIFDSIINYRHTFKAVKVECYLRGNIKRRINFKFTRNHYLVNSLIEHYYENNIDIKFSKKKIIIYCYSDFISFRIDHDNYFDNYAKKIEICVDDNFSDNYRCALRIIACN